MSSEITAEQLASIRTKIVEEIVEKTAHDFEERAEKTRREAFTPASGVALGATWDEAAQMTRRHATSPAG